MLSVAENRAPQNPDTQVGSDWRWTVLRFVIATVLLTAASMKAYQLATEPSLGEGLLNARWFNILVVEFELFLGIWLIIGILPRLSWLVTVGCFSVFALVSFYRALSGEVSCGCFGAVTVNPWITAVFNVGVIGCLSVSCPRKPMLTVDMPKTNPLESHWFSSTFLMTLIVIVATTTQVYLFFGSFVGLGSFMTPQEIAFEIDESFESPEKNVVRVIVKNKTEGIIRIVGVKTDCGCGKIDGIPVSVLARSHAHVFFVASEGAIDNPRKFGRTQRLVFFIDGEGARRAFAKLPLFEFLVRR